MLLKTLRTMLAVLVLASLVHAGAPENLAPKAKITADSEYNGQYKAAFVANGVIPKPMGKADIGKAWVVKGTTHGKRARITFEWPAPVTVAEAVYFGRTGWHWGENFRSYEVTLDDAKTPALKGTLKAGHGGQRITLPKPATVTKLAIQFIGSYGGPNPGASEIQVYAAPPPDKLVGAFTKPNPHDPEAPVFVPTLKESPELAADLKAGKLGFTKLVAVQRHHINCTHVYTYHCEGQRDGGGLCIVDLTDGSVKKIVDTADGQISSCDLSYDGKVVVFSLRKKGSPFYQVYTINVDGTGLKQITEGEYFNYDAAWMPDDRIVFLSSRIRQAAYCFFTPVGILYTMNADGTRQMKISSNYLNDFTPAVMNDGRIIYGRWEYVDRPAIPIQGLWTINSDGTMLQGYFGNRVLDPASFIEPQPIPGSTAILCTLTGHNGSCRGGIGIIDPTSGNNAQSGIRNLTPEIRLRGVNVSSNGPRGPYQTPFPIDETYYLVSHDGILLIRDYDTTVQNVVLPPKDSIGFYNPRPIRTRHRQAVRAEREPVDDPTPFASLYIQDIYNGLEPDVKRGEIKRVAVVQEIRRSLISSPGIYKPAFGFQRIVVSCGATYVPKKVLGFADVKPDGSAYFKVPAETPIYFIALDAQGRGVQRMRSFTHLMPGETQGCIGCHDP
ncbi:PD40 domain-containing protein, partial [bacterium]|nr:PD40 domain-containing protein [bacterium]